LESVYAWAIPVHATVILAEMIYSHVSEAKLYDKKDVATILSGIDEFRSGFI
jgi:hypothetical protein